MRKKGSNLPYITFVLRIIIHIGTFVLAIVIFLSFKEDAKTLFIKFLIFLMPISAAVIAFLDLHIRIKDLKDYMEKAKQIREN